MFLRFPGPHICYGVYVYVVCACMCVCACVEGKGGPTSVIMCVYNLGLVNIYSDPMTLTLIMVRCPDFIISGLTGVHACVSVVHSRLSSLLIQGVCVLQWVFGQYEWIRNWNYIIKSRSRDVHIIQWCRKMLFFYGGAPLIFF